MASSAAEARRARRNRVRLVCQIEAALEKPMIVLGLIWLALLVIELVRGLSPFMSALSTTIWILFGIEFLFRFAVAPAKLRYLRRNWLAALSLALPALRVFRVARVLKAARAARGLRLVRIVGSLNRAVRTTRTLLGRRGIGYVLALTAIVAAVGAAGIYGFERDVEGTGIDSYGDALWWTAMILLTMGSQYWPETGEGRILCVILAAYAFGVFGYITASIAAFLVGKDTAAEAPEPASDRTLQALEQQIAALRAELRTGLSRLDGTRATNLGERL